MGHDPEHVTRAGGFLPSPPEVRPPTTSQSASGVSGTVHGVTWLLFNDGHILLERCPKKAAVLGVGEWFVPGGKLEPGETADDALRRELSEEWPGVELMYAEPLPIIEGSAVPPGPRGVFLMRPYEIGVRGEIPAVSGDGVPLRWATIEEALSSPVPQVRMMVAAFVQQSAPSTASTGASEQADRVAPRDERLKALQLVHSLRATLSTKDAEIARLTEKAAAYDLVNTPELFDFMSAVHNEALHQRERWGVDADGGKADADWFWLIGYLAGKALHNPPKDDMPPVEARLHRIITVAAAAVNWHSATLGVYTRMRPGTASPTPPEARTDGQ